MNLRKINMKIIKYLKKKKGIRIQLEVSKEELEKYNLKLNKEFSFFWI